MVGADLILRVRRFLRDVESATVKGTFWSDDIILLCLNNAQDVLIQTAFKSNESLLLGLISDSGYQTYTGSILTLPADYLHYMSGMVGDASDDIRLARVYLGGEGYTYFDTIHDAVIILNNEIHYLKNGTATGGKLNYYKRPPEIVVGSFDDAFLPEIYYNVIARQASVILGIKETQTQRDYKNLIAVVTNIKSRSPDQSNYIVNNDSGAQS